MIRKEKNQFKKWEKRIAALEVTNPEKARRLKGKFAALKSKK